jgi:hypothetical protein
MALAIKNVKVVSHEGFGSFIIRIKAWFHDPKNVNQNGHLVTMPMHGLHFVLNFKAIVFAKSTTKTTTSSEKFSKQDLDILSCHLATKVVMHKELEFGLHIFQQFTINNTCKQVSIFFFLPTSSNNLFHRKKKLFHHGI